MSGEGFATYPRRAVEVLGLHGGQIRTVLRPDWRPGFDAHNDFVGTYVEMGIPGVTLWTGFVLGLLAAAAKAWRKTRDPVALGAFASMLALIIMSISDNVQSYDISYDFCAAVIVGLLAMSGRRDGAAQRQHRLRAASHRQHETDAALEVA
jgi:O-antigen ligase